MALWAIPVNKISKLWRRACNEIKVLFSPVNKINTDYLCQHTKNKNKKSLCVHWEKGGERERGRPVDFIISRARVSVSTKNQFEGNLALQRVNSLRKKGTSKLRALWVANTTYPPGFWWLLTNCSKIGIRSSILHLIYKTKVNLIVSKSELYWATISKIWALISLMILNNLSK